MSRRFVPQLLAIVISACLVAGVRAAAPAGATLSRIRAAGHVTFGYVADARPFSYKDAGGNPAGYAVELCGAVATQIRHDLAVPSLTETWVAVSRDDRFKALQDGRIDVLGGGDSATLSRREQVSFSIPIFPGGIGAMVRADAPVRLRNVLAGRGQTSRPVWRANATQLLQAREFAVVSGTTAQSWVSERLRELDIAAPVTTVNGYDAGVQRLIDRRSDVMFGERAVLLDVARRQIGRAHV